jgi:hypothetical protein
MSSTSAVQRFTAHTIRRPDLPWWTSLDNLRRCSRYRAQPIVSAALQRKKSAHAGKWRDDDANLAGRRCACGFCLRLFAAAGMHTIALTKNRPMIKIGG